MLIRIGMLGFLVLLIAACATEAGYAKVLDSWMGANEETLIESWGPPASVYESGGAKYITYVASSSGYVPGVAPSYQTTVYGSTAYTTPYGGTKGFFYNRNCATTFKIVNGVISHWQWKGNNCRQ